MFAGILLKESLSDESVLNSLNIEKLEHWKVENASPDQPADWTALYYSGEDSQVSEIAEKLSASLKQGPWYTNFTTKGDRVYVIFPDKIFTYRIGDQRARNEALEYGRSIAVPENQLDWRD